MKTSIRTLFYISLGLLSLALRVQASDSPDPRKFMQGLNNPDPKVRRTAIVAFEDSLGKQGVKEYGDNLLPVLLKALTDSDSEVRAEGVGALNMISHAIAWSRLQNGAPVLGTKISIQLLHEPRLKDAIVQRLNDPDNEVREFAISGLSLGYPPSSETEKILLGLWDKEANRTTHSPREAIQVHTIRKAILDGLGAGQYRSPETISALMQALDDKDVEIKGWAAHYISEMKVPEALPKLIAGSQSNDAFVKQKSIEALGKYGSNAKEYLPELERAYTTANDESTKQALSMAIQNIKGEKQ